MVMVLAEDEGHVGLGLVCGAVGVGTRAEWGGLLSFWKVVGGDRPSEGATPKFSCSLEPNSCLCNFELKKIKTYFSFWERFGVRCHI